MSDSQPRSVLRAIFSHPAVKLPIALVIILVPVIVASMVWMKWVQPVGLGPWGEVLGSAIVAALALASYALFVRAVERRPVAELSRAAAGPEWALGVALGFGAITLTVAVIAVLGGYTVIGTHPASVLVPVLALSISSGVVEEVLMRGVVFRLLEQWLGSWTALALSALMFGLLHVSNPNASVMAALAISIEAGILLGALYLLTRRLWMAIGLHMAWNFTQGGIYGIAISGIDMPGVLDSTVQGPVLLTGGEFGAEASLPAIIVCTALGLWVLRRAWRRGHFVAASWHRFRTGRDAPASS